MGCEIHGLHFQFRLQMAAQSAQEFIEHYLRSKAELQRSHFQLHKVLYEKYFGENLLNYYLDWERQRREKPERLISVEVSDNSAKAITIEHFGERQHRPCHLCNGVGWKDHRQNS
jgi:hypothetical protein